MAQSGSNNLRSTLACAHDFMFDFCCGLCERDGLQKEAVGYCANCEDYLCTDCFSNHLRPKPMRHHILLDQHQMPKDQQQNIGGDTCTEACTFHPHIAVAYFCSQHNELGCTVCMALNHCNCQDVEHIPDIASDILNNEEYIDFQKKITSVTHRANRAIQTSQDQTKLSQTYQTDALEDFQQFKKDISKAIYMMEKKLITETDILKGDDEKKMNTQEKKYKDVLKDIRSLSSTFNSLQNNGQFSQMFITMKRAWREIHAEGRLTDTEDIVQARNYRLIKGRELQLLLDAPETMLKLEVVEIAQAGANTTQSDTSVIQTHETNKKTNKTAVAPPKHKTAAVNQQTDGPATSSHNAPVSATIPNVRDARKTHVQGDGTAASLQKVPARAAIHHYRDARKTVAHHFKDVSVRSRGDSIITDIRGCIVLPSDKLAVVDYYNNKVKLIDLAHNDVVSQLKLPGRIWDITMVSSTRVAVTSPYTHTINIVNVSDKLNLDRRVKVKGQCRGISSLKDGFVVTYDKPVKVEILSMSGQVLQTVVSEDEGRELFTNPCYVAVSSNQQNLYISDMHRDTVTSVDLIGQVQATYKNAKLVGPHGLTVDSAGTVYVCGWTSNNILQLNGDLTEIQQLLNRSDGDIYPKSVYYCDTTDRLYVGLFDNDVVKVYQLKNKSFCPLM